MELGPGLAAIDWIGAGQIPDLLTAAQEPGGLQP
jgi:hypothetical protein